MDNKDDDIDADELRHLEEDNDGSGTAIVLSTKRRASAQPPTQTVVPNLSAKVVSVQSDNERDVIVNKSMKSATSSFHSSAASSPVSASSSPSSSAVDSSSASSASSESESEGGSEAEFNDGFDEDLMGDTADRARLKSLTEKERETEIFKRIERRDVMKTRWEIKRKLRLAKRTAAAARANVATETADQPGQSGRRAQKALKAIKVPTFDTMASNVVAPAATSDQHANKTLVPSGPTSTTTAPSKWLQPAPLAASMFEPMDFTESDDANRAREYFDPKERSKERKKNVEANRTDDKRSSAMAMLKAKREDKAKRGKL